MNSPVRYGIAAAAVLVLALIGYQLLPSSTGSGSGGTPVPTTPAASAAPLPPSGPIDAGTYRMGSGPTFLVTVPSGWVSRGDEGIRKNPDGPDEVALDVYPAELRVFADACDSESTEEPIGPSADDLVAALLAQENSDISEPADVTIGGLPGTRLEISAPAGLDVNECSIGSLQIWVDSGGTNYLAGVGGEDVPVVTVYIADTPGGRLAFAPHHGDATAADIAELDAVIASIGIVE